MARHPTFTDVCVDGGRADSGRVREVASVGAVRAGASAVRAEYAAPLSALAGESPHRSGATVWPADSAGVTEMGNPHPISGLGYFAAVESVLSDSAVGGVSGPGSAHRLGSD